MGNGRWVETHFVPLDFGNLMVTCFDVTNYKTIEIELRATRERLEAAAAAGVVGVWEYDFGSETAIWDSRMYQIHAATEADFATPLDAYFARLDPKPDPPDQPPRARSRARRRSGTRLSHRLAGRTNHYLRSFARPMLDSEGQPTRLVGIAYDVTEKTKTLQRSQRPKLRRKPPAGRSPNFSPTSATRSARRSTRSSG